VHAGTRLPSGMDATPGSPGSSGHAPAPSSPPAGTSAPPLASASGAPSGTHSTGPGAPSGAPSTWSAGDAAPADTLSQVVASGTDRPTGRTTATPQAIIPVTNAHSMRTRGKDGVRHLVDRLNLHMAALSPVPTSVRTSLSDPAWHLAM
jgi:hypothetical protein